MFLPISINRSGLRYLHCATNTCSNELLTLIYQRKNPNRGLIACYNAVLTRRLVAQKMCILLPTTSLVTITIRPQNNIMAITIILWVRGVHIILLEDTINQDIDRPSRRPLTQRSTPTRLNTSLTLILPLLPPL